MMAAVLNNTASADENGRSDETKGCGIICSPLSKYHRFLFLIFMCLLCFGVYFCYDNPAALQEYILADMGVNKESFMTLYAWYSWPSVIMALAGGFLIDKVFGVRLAAIIFAFLITAGQLVLGLGAYLDKFWVMQAGRCIFGMGGETLSVAQNTYAAAWFKGKELNMVFGIQLSMARIGSTVNMNAMQPIYKMMASKFHEDYLEGYKTLGYTLLFGLLFCIFSLCIALTLAFIDKRANRILGKEDARTGDVIRLRDIKDFPLSCWLIYIICVTYYVSVFCFIDLGVVFFQNKFGMSEAAASACNSLVFLISAGASPVFGFLVDRMGRSRYWLMLALLLSLASHILLAFTFLMPVIAMVIMGISYSLLACSLWPLIPNEVLDHQVGTAYGMMQSFQNLGLGVFAILSGKIVDSSGYLMLEAFLIISLCVSMVATIILYFWDAAMDHGMNLSAKERKARENSKSTGKDACMGVGDGDAITAENKPLIEP